MCVCVCMCVRVCVRVCVCVCVCVCVLAATPKHIGSFLHQHSEKPNIQCVVG